ncbi:MAG: succinate dehydrogenase cytochrome b subunit [Candidatus Hydrogenedentes bacterium]|nr:succinate dehydrogenase cytochrome b subunit [Candidatus Hydrogenedentota bacterium]
MITKLAPFFRSSVFKKQLVAITGLILVGFIIVHMAGNFILFFGPEAFNHYSETLHAVPELLWIARAVLIVAAVVHIRFSILVTRENRKSGGTNRYAVAATRGETNFAKKFMILTGALLFLFLFLHLSDFTIAGKTGPSVELKGQEYELYGLVWNSFLNPLRVVIYLAAVWCVGMHLSHGIQSMFQSIGFYHDRYTPVIRQASLVIGAVVACGFSLVPIYVIVRNIIGGPAV